MYYKCNTKTIAFYNFFYIFFRVILKIKEFDIKKIIPVLEIKLPVKIAVSKNKFLSINLNQYRNAHHRVLHNAKTKFHLYVKELELKNTIDFPVFIRYSMHMPTRRIYDVMNVGTVADKFACDALVECGVLKDDNYQQVKEVSCRHQSIDKKNPRIIMSLYDYDDCKEVLNLFDTWEE